MNMSQHNFNNSDLPEFPVPFETPAEAQEFVCPDCGGVMREVTGYDEPDQRITIWHIGDGSSSPLEVIEDVVDAYNENGFLIIESITALGSDITTAIRLDGVTRWELRPMEG
jgi:transcription initiation factor IIE alpha subunit